MAINTSSIVVQWNCRGLTSKVTEINLRIKEGKLFPWAFLLQEHNALCRISGFCGYHTPSIPDRRHIDNSLYPGKAAVYVNSSVPHTSLNLQKWCNTRQEVVAALTQPARTPVILVSYYGRPSSSSPNLGWLRHLRAAHPSVPILVGGDFNGAHSAWGYSADSPRGTHINDTFSDRNFLLLNLPGTHTRPRAGLSSPDLTWWLGPSNPRWHVEPDTWGSDHAPIFIHLAETQLRKLRRFVRTTSWDAVRADDRTTTLTPATALQTLSTVLSAHTTKTTVDEDQPNPDTYLLNLWAHRRQADLYVSRNPDDSSALVALHKVTAKARQYGKQLCRSRWLDWCDCLSSTRGNRHLWRVFHAMEKSPTVKDYAESIRLAMALDEDAFAQQAAAHFFPHHDRPAIPPPPNPVEDSEDPAASDFTLAELISAIEKVKANTAPGHDGLPYAVFRNLEGAALESLLETFNEVWRTGFIPPDWKHSIVVPIPKTGQPPTSLSALRPISLTPTICKLYERLVAARLSWWLEERHCYPDAQIGFRPHFGTEDGLDIFASDVIQCSPHSHVVRTVLATDISKAYDNVMHHAILDSMATLGVPHRICLTIYSLLSNRTFGIRIRGHSVGHFVSNRGVPQGSVLAPTLFNIAFIPMVKALSSLSDIGVMAYADDITLWSRQPSLTRQQTALQVALDTMAHHLQPLGLTLSPTKTCYVHIGNKAGRRRLTTTPMTFSIDSQPIPEVDRVRILGLLLHASGSGTPWLADIRKSSRTTLGLIRRIARRAGGARSHTARQLVRAIFQPRILYQAQFHRLTQKQWSSLEALNREAMRVITGLPRITPIPVLQEHAQLNTLTELIEQRETNRARKRSLALHRRPSLPPWAYCQVTTNRPTTNKTPPLPDIYPGVCTVYSDASLEGFCGTTAFHSPSHPSITDQHRYSMDHPSSLALELQAILDALRCLPSAPSFCSVNIYTDSLAAIKHLKLTRGTLKVAQEIHTFCSSYPTSVRIHWVRGHNGDSNNELADSLARAPTATSSSPTPFPPDPLLAHISSSHLLRMRTRALIPPCSHPLPRNLTREEETSLRRIRAGVALTPAVRHRWRDRTLPATGHCPHCSAPADACDIKHLLWSCPETAPVRDRLLREVGLRSNRPSDYDEWTTNNSYTDSLCAYLRETGLHAYL